MRDYFDYLTLIEKLGVHSLLGGTGEGWGIEQNPHELATFLFELPPDVRTVLEIGTGHKAGLSRLMSECLGWQVTTVDRQIPYPTPALVRQVIGDSHDPQIVAAVRGSYDLVIIDADHAYEAARQDYEHYGAMGRIVMFHDIAGLRDCEGAARLWWELSRYNDSAHLKPGYYEVVAEGVQRAGIGWMVTP